LLLVQGCVNNSTAGRKLVRFSFPATFAGPRAQEQSVHLIGSFTGWQVRRQLQRPAAWLVGWLAGLHVLKQQQQHSWEIQVKSVGRRQHHRLLCLQD
jgi:hypothetical protein